MHIWDIQQVFSVSTLADKSGVIFRLYSDGGLALSGALIEPATICILQGYLLRPLRSTYFNENMLYTMKNKS